MKLTSRIKLYTNQEDKNSLLDTLSDFNSACNLISQLALYNLTFGTYDLQRLAYDYIRSEFPNLQANHVVRAIARVSASYKELNKEEKQNYAKFKNGEAASWQRVLRTFKWRNGIELDARLWSFLKDGSLSIASVNGRIKNISWYANDHNYGLLSYRTDSAMLVYRKSGFYLHVTCKVPENDLVVSDDFIGVDLGINKIATTSDNESWDGTAIENKRNWYAWRKAELQKAGTKSAKRRLKKLSGREKRFKRDVDHCISKHVVLNAERTNRGIALENLSSINERLRAIRKSQRAKHSNWSFYRLQNYIQYKARLAGVNVVCVDPAYTSQMCNNCSYTDKNNRKTQSDFVCKSCGYKANADYNAALNIRNRAIQQAYGRFDLQAN